jgi:uncharacterized protein (DUF433 family)
MNWSECREVEQIRGKVSGQPVVKGTRILADAIVEDYELGSGFEEIHENYPSLSVERIRKLIAFAHSHQPQPGEGSLGREPPAQAARASVEARNVGGRR